MNCQVTGGRPRAMREAAPEARPLGRWVTLGPPLYFLGLRWGLSWAESPPKAVWSPRPPWPAVTLSQPRLPPITPAWPGTGFPVSCPPAQLTRGCRAGPVAARRCQDGLPFGQSVFGRGAADVGICPEQGHSGVCVKMDTVWPCHDPPRPPKASQWPPGALSMPREGRWPVRMEDSPQLLPDGEQNRGRHLSSQQLPRALTGREGATHPAGALFGVPAPPTGLQSPHLPGGHPLPPLGVPGCPCAGRELGGWGGQ